MERKDVIIEILNTYGASTARQISVLAKIRYNEDIPANSIGGILRSMASKGQVVVSKNEHNANVYWLVD
jgi:predicted transcriptional regulator